MIQQINNGERVSVNKPNCVASGKITSHVFKDVVAPDGKSLTQGESLGYGVTLDHCGLETYVQVNQL